MLYTENFKRQVVKKVLSPGVICNEVARKLKISANTIHKWKKVYADEVKAEIVQIDVERLLHEEPVDIEKMLIEAEPEAERRELQVLNRIAKGLPAALGEKELEI